MVVLGSKIHACLYRGRGGCIRRILWPVRHTHTPLYIDHAGRTLNLSLRQRHTATAHVVGTEEGFSGARKATASPSSEEKPGRDFCLLGPMSVPRFVSMSLQGNPLPSSLLLTNVGDGLAVCLWCTGITLRAALKQAFDCFRTNVFAPPRSYPSSQSVPVSAQAPLI